MFKNGTIPHLEHVWMPQKDGIREAFMFSLEALGDVYANHKQVNLCLFHATKKVDDAMSCLIRKVNGTMHLAYKAKEPVWYNPHFPIVDAGLKTEKLNILRAHITEIFGNEDNVQYQIGFMHYDENGLPATVYPNIVVYELPNVTTQKLAIVLVSRTVLDESGRVISFSFNTNRDHHVGRDNTENVYFYNNELGFSDRKFSTEDLLSSVIYRELETAWTLFNFLDERGAWSSIEVDDDLQMFLNKKNRDDDWNKVNIINEYCQFMTSRYLDKRMKLKRAYPITKLDHKHDLKEGNVKVHNRCFYEVLFEMVYRIRRAAQWIVWDTCPIDSEGIVISLPTHDGIVAFKAVDPDFTKKNHEKWREM